MLRVDLWLILASRGVSLPADANKQTLIEAVKEITPQEQQMLYDFNHIEVDTSPYHRYTPKELKNYMQLKSGHTFPLPLGVLKRNHQKHQILSYYVLIGCPIIYPQLAFTQEQLEVISVREPGIYCINAGPGTGKTTVANERAFQLRYEGCLLISFTNEAINENYKRLLTYPEITGVIGKKDFQKKLTVATVDSLALWLAQDKGKCHDATIRTAIERLKRDPEIFTLFMPPGQPVLYRHIICDECQDIDDLRGELVLTLFKAIPKATLCLFGDPRQRIHANAGCWYSQLWTSQPSFGFSISHRFYNSALLNLANHLSEQRPRLHHALTITHSDIDTPMGILSVYEPYDQIQLDELAKFIRQIHDTHQISYNDIAVIGPSLNRDNQTSRWMHKICAALKDHQIPCYTRTEGSYQPTGIVFLTIHAAKGKEFDYVFLVGMSNYPHTFAMIDQESADSLTFVAHTRARRQIFYIAPESFIAPHGVSPEFIHKYTPPKQRNKRAPEPSDPMFALTDVGTDFGFLKLLQTNNFTFETQPTQKCTLTPAMKVLVNRRIPDVCVKLCHKQFKVLTNTEYMRWRYQGVLVNGLCKGVLYINRDLSQLDSTDLQAAVEENDYTDPVVTQWYVRLTKGIVEVPLLDKFDESSEYIESKEYTDIDVEVRFGSIHGNVDLTTPTTVVSFESGLHALLTGVITNKTGIWINDGTMYTVTSPVAPIRWRYLLRAWIQLKTHLHKVTYRQNKLIQRGYVPPPIPPNCFAVDTEFVDGEIFDIAIINLNDPYASIIQTLQVNNTPFACEWIGQPEELFHSSITLSALITQFTQLKNIHRNSKPTLLYYASPVDHSWYQGAHVVNLGEPARAYAKRNGVFIDGSQPPKLTDLYTLVSLPLEFQPHLRPHTALSDALMLYELVVCADLPLAPTTSIPLPIKSPPQVSHDSINSLEDFLK